MQGAENERRREWRYEKFRGAGSEEIAGGCADDEEGSAKARRLVQREGDVQRAKFGACARRYEAGWKPAVHSSRVPLRTI